MYDVCIAHTLNEVEAQLVVNVLIESGVSARSDAVDSSSVFGGLSFESGHAVFVPVGSVRKAREVLSHYPHFKDLKHVGGESGPK